MIFSIDDNSNAGKAFWASAVFYLLIGFEFLYMASPFAAYFYSVYKPVLNYLNDSQAWWLTRFFMPHFTDTSSAIINLHNTVGGLLAALGFLGFLIGAIQVYYNKLTKKGVVLGGVYRIIRHPQYTSFAICGLGLLILWPRYIVLITFITMLFIYYTLAKIEEHECEIKFGQSYLDYKRTTNMFFPISIPFPRPLSKIITALPRWSKITLVLVLYLAVLYASIETIEIVEIKSIDSLYKFSAANSETVSVVQLAPDRIKLITDIAAADNYVKKRLAMSGKDAKFLNYVLPSEWYIPELPMKIKGDTNHFQPTDYNRNLYRIIFTQAELKPICPESPFLTQVVKCDPVVEAVVDILRKKVIEINKPPKSVMYNNIPEAIY